MDFVSRPAHLMGFHFVASQSGYWKLWSGKERMMVFALWHLAIPIATAWLGYFPGWMLGNAEDIPSGVAREWARWGRMTEVFDQTHS